MAAADKKEDAISWQQIMQLLARPGGVPSACEAAAALGIGRTTFKRALRRHGLAVWPHRAAAAVAAALRGHKQQLAGAGAGGVPAHVRKALQSDCDALARWQRALLADPRRHTTGARVRVPADADRVIKAFHRRRYKRQLAAAAALSKLVADDGSSSEV